MNTLITNGAYETMGQIWGLLEAWGELGMGADASEAIAKLTARQACRVRELRDALPMSFVVEQMGEGMPTTKKLLVALAQM